MRVLVTGIFDLVHVEHVRFLASAKNLNHKSPAFACQSPASRTIRSRLMARYSAGREIINHKQEECYLIVGIEADVRVKNLKGEGRPVMGQEDRKEMLEGLKMVDEVIILPDKFDSDDDYLKLLREVKPDIYAVSENSPFMENKRRICEKAGVKCMVVRKFNPEYSTTKLIEKVCLR